MRIYSIGEFSKSTGLSVKTLRFCYEKGIFVPSSVDDISGWCILDDGLPDPNGSIKRRLVGGYHRHFDSRPDPVWPFDHAMGFVLQFRALLLTQPTVAPYKGRDGQALRVTSTGLCLGHEIRTTDSRRNL